MRTVNAVLGAILGLALASVTADVQAGSHDKATHAKKSELDIIETATQAGSFKTLSSALAEAGLVETLKGAGPFTVFAPNDEAFSKLPKGTLDSLLKNPDELRKVLTYHVVPGKLMAADVVGKANLKTVQGQSLPVKSEKGVHVGTAKVIQTDILTRNGVIHVIDSVVIPSKSM